MAERQTQILNTAIEVLAHKGLAHLTHRAVDARAGLPQGSTSYYFSKKQDLIEATASHLAHLLETDCIDVKKQFAEMIADGKREAAISFVSTDLVKFAQEKSDWLL
ncbi:MAG: TetR family transcriptional regulator, partial [Pseudomonadota bacterium]